MKHNKMELPIKGKDVIAHCSDGSKMYLFRCACANDKCEDWRCSVSGSAIITKVTKWEYC